MPVITSNEKQSSRKKIRCLFHLPESVACCSSHGVDALPFCCAHPHLHMGSFSLQGHAEEGWQVFSVSSVTQQGLCSSEHPCSLTEGRERQPLYSEIEQKSCCVSVILFFPIPEIIQNTFHKPFMFGDFRINDYF